jgi:membrane protein required for colicin V production
MLETHLNMFDVTVALIIGLSAMLSFFRGFVREVLGISAWVGAAVVTLYLFPDVAAWIRPHVDSMAIASGFASLGTFIIALLLFSVFTSMLMKYLKSGADVGFLDNMLGLAFGVARGGLLIAIAYYIMAMVMNEGEYPEFVQTAVTRPYVERGAQWVATMAPDYLKEIAPDTMDGAPEEVEEVPEQAPLPETGAGKYRWDSMEKLQQMIDEKAKE